MSGTPSSNVFTLQGTVKNNTISDAWMHRIRKLHDDEDVGKIVSVPRL